MLGNLISDTTGKRVLRRVLSGDPLKVEVSFEETGTTLGIPITGFGTYSSIARADGTIYGEGEGVLTTADGELVTWKGSGLGKFGPAGSVSYRGILYYRTASQKLAALNTVGGVFEYDVDPEGKSRTRSWEWK